MIQAIIFRSLSTTIRVLKQSIQAVFLDIVQIYGVFPCSPNPNFNILVEYYYSTKIFTQPNGTKHLNQKITHRSNHW